MNLSRSLCCNNDFKHDQSPQLCPCSHCSTLRPYLTHYQSSQHHGCQKCQEHQKHFYWITVSQIKSSNEALWGVGWRKVQAGIVVTRFNLVICLFCVDDCLQCLLNWFCITELQSDKYNQWTKIRQTQLLSFAATVMWSSVCTPARKYEGMQFTGICCPSVLV